MKIAFHFNADHKSFGSYYGEEIENLVFSNLLQCDDLNISSKIFVGDLLLNSLAKYKGKFDESKYKENFDSWLNQNDNIWKCMIVERLQPVKINACSVYVMCFESIDFYLADKISKLLTECSEAYLGVMQIDETSELHWVLYSHFLVPKYRIMDHKANIFWDSIHGDESKNYFSIQRFEKIGFEKVEFEDLKGRYSIFDEYHDFEHAKRTAKWKQQCGGLLAFMIDDVTYRLGDIAPKLSDQLYSMLNTYNTAETDENLSQVCVTCRRIFEYVINQIFPPQKEKNKDGKSLGEQQFRNRLYEYADISRKSDTNIDVICINTQTLFEQCKKLDTLVNKGIHQEVYRVETRRCIIRTIMLLDDIISLKEGAFAHNMVVDEKLLKSILGDEE